MITIIVTGLVLLLGIVAGASREYIRSDPIKFLKSIPFAPISRYSSLYRLWPYIVFAMAVAIFLTVRLLLPSTDAKMFVPWAVKISGGPPDRDPVLNFEFQRWVRLREGFRIALLAEADPGQQLPATKYSATVTAPADMRLVTARHCDEATSGNELSITSVTACSTTSTHAPRTTIDVIWYAVGSETGIYPVTLSTGNFPLPPFPLKAAVWIGSQFRLVPMKQIGDTFRLDYDQLEFDVANHELRFPVVVVTTLGVTQRIYDLLAVCASVIVLLFGNGIFRRRDKAPTTDDN